MALQYVKLAPPQYLAGSVAPVYTNPSGKTFVSGFIVFNGNTAPETVNLYTVPAVGGALSAAGSVHRWWSNAINAKETVFIDALNPIILDSQYDSIFGWCESTNNRVTIQVLGNRDA
jgi:hypothetical protein